MNFLFPLLNAAANTYDPENYNIGLVDGLTVALGGYGVVFAGLIALMLWAFRTDPVGAPPLPLLVVLVAMPGLVILGVLLALWQRIREIGKGEIDDAKHF